MSGWPSCLAVLLGGPWRGENAMHGDLLAMHEALRERGLRPDEILSLEGRLDRELVLAFLASVHGRLEGRSEGEVFLYYSGHGAYAPLDATDAAGADPALIFRREDAESPDRWVLWREVFAALAGPPGVRLLVLPDC